MMKSFDAEATKVSLELTARSVMSPFQAYIMKYEDITRRTYKYVFIHREGKKKGVGRVEGGGGRTMEFLYELTSCPRQLAKQYAVSIDQIFTRRSSEPVITYRPDRSNMAACQVSDRTQQHQPPNQYVVHRF